MQAFLCAKGLFCECFVKVHKKYVARRFLLVEKCPRPRNSGIFLSLIHICYCGKIGEKAHTVEAGEDSITVDGKKITIYAMKDAKDLPWGAHLYPYRQYPTT